MKKKKNFNLSEVSDGKECVSVLCTNISERKIDAGVKIDSKDRKSLPYLPSWSSNQAKFGWPYKTQRFPPLWTP